MLLNRPPAFPDVIEAAKCRISKSVKGQSTRQSEIIRCHVMLTRARLRPHCQNWPPDTLCSLSFPLPCVIGIALLTLTELP